MDLMGKKLFFIGLLAAFDVSAQSLTLAQALSRVEQHPQWQEAQAQIEQAIGEQQTAVQYPNPSVEFITETRDKRSIAFYQSLETAAVRQSSQASAEKGVAIASYQSAWLRRQLEADIERSYYNIMQRQQELTLSNETLELLTQLRHAVVLRVQVGESPRYEAVKAEAEWLTSKSRQLAATQSLQLARLQLTEKLALEQLPEVIQVLPVESQVCALAKIEANPIHEHPMTNQAASSLAQSQDNLRHEQAQVTPQPTLILGAEQDMGVDRVKLGVSFPLPLWHQRDGQIASAKARTTQAQNHLLVVERQLKQDWGRAVLSYQIANTQLESFESGLLFEAQAAFNVAKAAYKYGERSILDYIDAQRTLAIVKQNYINSQFDRHYACIDILQLSVSTQVLP